MGRGEVTVMLSRAQGALRIAGAGRVGAGAGRSPAADAAVTASVVLPLAMASGIGLTGALQRMLFLVAYLWYGLEAVPSHGGEPLTGGGR